MFGRKKRINGKRLDKLKLCIILSIKKGNYYE